MVTSWQKHLLRHLPSVRGIHRFPVDFPHERVVKWTIDIIFDVSLNQLLNNRLTVDLRRHATHVSSL